jgi:hypothetical protein
MEPTPEPVPQDEDAERHEQEDSARYPDHGDPDALRERAGLDPEGAGEGGGSPGPG